MKESFWGIFIVTLGVIGISVINMFQTIVTTGTHDYYLLKEVTEASMMDAVDLGHYRIYGEIRIIEQKFMENFLRRFSESFGRTGDREVVFYHINEKPPKVTIGIDVGFDAKVYNFDAVDFNISNIISGILEMKTPFYVGEQEEEEEIILEVPDTPGSFTSPTSNTRIDTGMTIGVKWGAVSYWGNPNYNPNYRLESKCSDGPWAIVANTGISSHRTDIVKCSSGTLQYRVRAESAGGVSEWRYSETTKPIITEYVFSYAGKVQEIVAPVTGTYKLEVWGAQGGTAYGGKGGYASGEIKLNKGQKIYVYIGGQGSSSKNVINGGWNGGGKNGDSSDSAQSGSGGGSTDIRVGGTALSNRLIVAGGGGGGTSEGNKKGGIGGGLTGGNGEAKSSSYYGRGGTQTAGGKGATGATNGSLGIGGNGDKANGSTSDSGGGGGGGGYYGGGGGHGCDNNSSMGGGGGGSSYIGGVTKGTTQSGVNAGYGKAKITLIN
jgi:hypothetical protein